MFFRFLLCVCLVIKIINAKTYDEVKSWYVRQALDCSKDFPLSHDEMIMLQKHKLPDNKNAKCLLRCVFNRANFIDSKGMFDAESATKQATSDYEGDDTKVENSKKLMEVCKKVNSEAVGDGEEGCDRSLLLFKCFKENGPQLGFPTHTMEME